MMNRVSGFLKPAQIAPPQGAGGALGRSARHPYRVVQKLGGDTGYEGRSELQGEPQKFLIAFLPPPPQPNPTESQQAGR